MQAISFDPIIAEAYRRAALEGRDMYAFAGQMERLKTAVQAETEFYKQWERLDDLIGELLWVSGDPYHFLLVREVFTDDLEGLFTNLVLEPGAEDRGDWQRWLAAFSEASFHWRPDALRALCQAPGLEQRFEKKLKPYSRFIEYFKDRRWVETRAVFEELATKPDLPEEQRGYHHYVCGQIDLYFHYEYEQAKELFETAKKMLSGKALSLHGLIEYYLKGPEKEKDLDRALALADEALQLEPNHASSIIQKADVLTEKGQLAEAENLYRLASRKRPGYTQCYTRLIDLYGKADWFEKKETELEPLLELVAQLDPLTNFLARTDLGAIYQQQGETFWPKAEKLHQEAIRQYPEGIMALLNLGYFYLDNPKQPEKAEAIFKQTLEKAPEAREGYLGMARLYETRENWEAAIQQYEQVQTIIPSWERFMQASISRCLREQNQPESAEKALLRAWELDSYDDSGALAELYELAQKLYKDPEHPKPEQAVQLLERAAKARNTSSENAAGITNRQGHAYFYVERYAEALPFYEKSAALVPKEPVYFTNQFDCLEKLYRQNPNETLYEKAQKALSQAAALAPQDSSIPKKRRLLALLRYNPHLAELPILYQVHVEVGQPLLSEITLDSQSLLPDMLAKTEALRERMNERFGINLPGLRYRDISDADGVYQFRMYETPVWLDQLKEQPPTMAAVLEQLERFFSYYSLDLFVNYWDVDREVPLLPNAELVHFTRVLMALLSEQTPLPPFPQVHQLYRRLEGLRQPVATAVEQLRLQDALRAKLPGTQANFQYLPLGETEERKLAACLIGQGNARALALPMAYTRTFLGAFMRSLQEYEGRDIALVTSKESLRPYLRSLLAGMPQIPVLKTSELSPEAKDRYLEPLVTAGEDEALFQQTFQQLQSLSDQQAPQP